MDEKASIVYGENGSGVVSTVSIKEFVDIIKRLHGFYLKGLKFPQ